MVELIDIMEYHKQEGDIKAREWEARIAIEDLDKDLLFLPHGILAKTYL